MIIPLLALIGLAKGHIVQTPVPVAQSAPVTYNGGFHDLQGATISSPGIILENGAVLEHAVINCTDPTKDAITITGSGAQVLDCQIGAPSFSYPSGYTLPFQSHDGINVVSGEAYIQNCHITAYSNIGLLFGPGSNDGVGSALWISSNIREKGHLPFAALYLCSGDRVTNFHLWGDHKYTCFLDGERDALGNGEIERGLPYALVLCGIDHIVSSSVQVYDASPKTDTMLTYGVAMGLDQYDGLNNTGGYLKFTSPKCVIGFNGEPGSVQLRQFTGGAILPSGKSYENDVAGINVIAVPATTTTKAMAKSRFSLR